MNKSYRTIGSSLFMNENINHIPKWINDIDFQEDKPLEPIDNNIFQKQAAFNAMPKVSRDGRNFNSRPICNNLNNNELILNAKIELAKFLSGYHYNTNAQKINNNIELTTKIVNVPATFLFKYSYNNGKIKAAKLFNIDVNDGEYPFSRSGLNECISDLKNGRVKTATKADAYTAYTITLEEVIRRFNGDQRAAMDKVRALVASKDIIGVGSNTFATCYAIDSLFPKMKKEGTIDKVPSFEFVKNKEHVATNQNATAASLIIEASKKLHNLFTDFRIKSFTRDKDKLVVTADILHNKIKKCVAFNFNIEDENVQGIAYIDNNGNNVSLKAFLEENENSNILNNFNKNDDKYLTNGIVLTKTFIFNQLQNLISKNNIQAIIDNWCERELVTIIDSNTYISKYSFNELLNQVNTKLLTEDEINSLYRFSSRIQSYLDRIDVEDNIRDYNIVFSPMIRLTNLYNRLYKFLDKFEIDDINDDCTRVNVINLSERGPEKFVFIAKYNGNNCIDITTNDEKNITAALKLYKKANKNNIFAKSVFSNQMLTNALNTVFKDYNFSNIKKRFNLQKIGSNFYASEYPVSAIINIIAQENLAQTLTKDERKQQLQKCARVINDINRIDIQDIIRDSIDYSRIIRLASAYNKLSQQLPKFSLLKYNDDCSKIKLKIFDEQGIKNLIVTAQYKDNKCINVHIPNIIDSPGLTLYKQANKNNTFAKSIFSKKMLLNVFSNIFKNPEKITNIVLTKIAKKLDNNFYASEYPISAIINHLSKHNCLILNNQERKELLDIQAHFGKKITAAYEKDTGIRDNNVIISKSIRLANAYPLIAKKYNQFNIIDINDDATNIEIGQVSPIGLSKYKIIIAYNNNKPIKINDEIINQIQVKKIVANYQNRYGNNLKYAKSIFTKNMLLTLLKSFTKPEHLEKVAENILSRVHKLDNNYYASDKPIVSLLNDEQITLNKTYDLQKRVDEQVNRNDIIDTGIRDVTFTDNLISASNKASKYLNQYFNNINFYNANLNQETLQYQCELFDEQTGLKNFINCYFTFKDGQIIDCKVDINKHLVPIDKVKQAFASNNILNKYLKYNNEKKTNAPIIISTNHLIDKLANLTIKNKDELKQVINDWNNQGKITKIATNAYASKYTIEQLLVMSNLKALTDEEIKYKLCKRNNLLKVSAAYIKDTGDRKIKQNWTFDRYIRFIHSQLDKLSNYVKIFDVNIDDIKLNVIAEIGCQGLRHTINFNWDLNNTSPENLTYSLPEISPVVKRYIDNNSSKNEFDINFTDGQLANKLYSYVDKDTVKQACKLFTDKNMLLKNGNIYYSKYSIPELLQYMDKYKLIDNNKVNAEIKLANKQIAIDTSSYIASDDTRLLETDSKKEYINMANQKLTNNIKLAQANQLITKRKANEWLALLNDNNNIIKVHKEFTSYLRGE